MKQPGESEKEIDTRYFDSLAEQRIRAAQNEGAFQNLAGQGQPIPELDGRVDDQYWWVRKKLQRESASLLPVSLQIRLEVEQALERIAGLKTESAVRREVAAINERIRDAHFRAVNGPPMTTQPLDMEEVVREWKASREDVG